MAAQVTTLDDLNGLMRSMMKTALERMLNTEMDVHLGRRTAAGVAEEAEAAVENAAGSTPAPLPPRNRRNGHSQKTVSGDMGELTLQTPRDRHSSFEPQLIGKMIADSPASMKRSWLCMPRE